MLLALEAILVSGGAYKQGISKSCLKERLSKEGLWDSYRYLSGSVEQTEFSNRGVGFSIVWGCYPC